MTTPRDLSPEEIDQAMPGAREVARGLDHTIYDLGDGRWARVPRRPAAAVAAERERFVLPRLSALPLAVPTIVGEIPPEPLLPMGAVVVRRLPGREAQPGEALSRRDAVRMARFLRALHATPPPPGLPGDELGLARAERYLSRADTALAALPTADAERYAAPARARFGPPFPPPAEELVWVHGDLHVRNTLFRAGRLAAVIDWGDAHVGDPGLDLGVRVALVRPQDRGHFDRAYGPADPARIELGRRRAALTALVLLRLAHEADSPDAAAVARAVLNRALAG